MSRLFDRYDESAVARLFEGAGVLAILRAKGFDGFGVAIAAAGGVPHVTLSAHKDGRRHLLLEACLRRVVAAAEDAGSSALTIEPPLDLLLVHWVREQDPTSAFPPGRPRLPLQIHPGLGVLRRAFRVAARIATDLAADAVASRPKFFHDAVIFHRSRLFLFLDGHEQGRFEALERDLGALPLSDATVAVAGWCVRDDADRVVRWTPGYQVFPVSPRLASHFHSARYADEVAAARSASRFRIDAAALAAVSTQLREARA